MLLFGAFIFIGIYGYTTLMDRANYAVYIEAFRGVLGIVLIVITKDRFGLDTYFSFGILLVAIYFLITILGGFYFTYFEKLRLLQKQ